MKVQFGDERLPDRFWESVLEDAAGCWLWLAGKGSGGYAHVGAGRGGTKFGGNVLGHRLAYETLLGPIPEGLHIDHLCRVRHCVNPSHMEPVTSGENSRRSPIIGQAEATVTHCPKGHAYEGDNLIERTQREGRHKHRLCRECLRAKWKRDRVKRGERRREARGGVRAG